MNKLALELHVPATRIGEIVHERRRITAETALRLARYFHNNPEFWLNLQNFYDLEVSRRSGKASEIEHQVTPAPSLTLDTACARRQIEFETPEGSVRKHLNVRTKAKSRPRDSNASAPALTEKAESLLANCESERTKA